MATAAQVTPPAGAVGVMTPLIGKQQLAVILELMQGEEREYFMEKMVEMASIVREIPLLMATDSQGDEALVRLHYFTPGGDWWVMERDGDDAFGFADLGFFEMGSMNIAEILSVNAELDLHFTPRTAGQLKKERT